MWVKNRLYIQSKRFPRKLWSTIKEVTGKYTNIGFPDHFISGDNVINDEKEIADSFNDYFVHIGERLAKKIEVVNKSPLDYLTTRNIQSMFLEPVATMIIYRVISYLKNTSAGHDKISARILKEIAHIVAEPLSRKINLSLYHGIVPDELKSAKVIPIYKAEDKHSFAN